MAVVEEEEELTPIVCPRCGSRLAHGAGFGADACPTCKARSLTPSQVAISKDRQRRTSQQVEVFERGAAELATRLEARGQTETARLLALELRALEVEFASWAVAPPPAETRPAKIARLVDLSRQAFSLLGLER